MRRNFTDAAKIISCNTHEKFFNDLSCYSPKIKGRISNQKISLKFISFLLP